MKKNDKPKTKKITDEIRRERKFSLSEAIARQAPGALKGASPVARNQQMVLEIEEMLDTHLEDIPGSLKRTIASQLKHNPPLLAKHHESALDALHEYVTTILDSDSLLKALVRDTDARWGRDFQERPHFEKEGHPPSADDPYTWACVRSRLQDLLQALTCDD